MRKVLTLLVAALVVGAYLGGWWPERQRRLALESQVRSLEERLAEAESRVHLAALLGQALILGEAIGEKNYGQAQGLSTKFFDDARIELGRATRPSDRTALEGVLAMRDSLTASLTRGEPAAMDVVLGARARLRSALGYPAIAAPVPVPPTVPSPSATPQP